MLCPQCRQQIPDGSRFCNLCGTAISMPPAQPSLLMGNDDQPLAVLHPSFIFVGIRYAVAVVLTIAMVLVGAFLSAKASQAFPALSAAVPWVIVFLTLIVFSNPIYHHIRRQFETYTVTSGKVEIQTGILSRTTRDIPLAKIQDVTTRATVLERLLGLGDVVIDSAAETGKITLRSIPKPQSLSDEILRRMNR